MKERPVGKYIHCCALQQRRAPNKFPLTYSSQGKAGRRFLHTACPLSEFDVEHCYKLEVEL
jgi:hypothetical protein